MDQSKITTCYTIKTAHESPPIPDRSCDWSAWRDGYEEGPVGWGATEAAALEDLRIQTGGKMSKPLAVPLTQAQLIQLERLLKAYRSMICNPSDAASDGQPLAGEVIAVVVRWVSADIVR